MPPREALSHRLSFAVRFVDHFSGEPVADELPVRLADTLQRPATRSDGAGHRQPDGTYRFLNAPDGDVTVLWRQPFERTQAGWSRFAADPVIHLPLADAATPVAVDLWPSAGAQAPASATGVRGKLVGANAGGLTVRIARFGQPFDRFTLSDAAGEFLFLPPGRLTPDPATGRVPLSIEVRQPGGALRAVIGGAFLPPTAGAAFAAADFDIAPRTLPRIRFQLA